VLEAPKKGKIKGLLSCRHTSTSLMKSVRSVVASNSLIATSSPRHLPRQTTL
jgi:hypothetical protein